MVASDNPVGDIFFLICLQNFSQTRRNAMYYLLGGWCFSMEIDGSDVGLRDAPF